MVDFHSLYPVVHDLTDVEYSSLTCCDWDALVMDVCNFNETIPKKMIGTPGSTTTSRALVSPDSNKKSGLFPKSRRKTQLDEQRQQQSQERDLSSQVESEEIVAEGEKIAKKLQTFDQVYVLTRQIACGSFSTVWETIHRRSGMRFAAKIIDRRQLTRQEDAEVYKEVAIMSHLRKSRGICHLQEFFDEPTNFFLVMDYAEGGNLQTRILKQEGGYYYKEHEVRELALSLLECLRSIHAEGVCHRDLKPEQILFLQNEASQDVVICDFGLAERLDGTNKLTDQCGTPSYVAPELIKGDAYDTQADLWSVGVILYVCMVGYLPFWDKTKRGLFRKITKGDYRLDSRDWSRVSRTAKNFISHLMEVDPSKRLTAEQALQHPWLASPAITDNVAKGRPLKKILKTSTPKKNRRRVWFALGGGRNSRPEKHTPQQEEEEDVQSTCSQTLSSVSSSDIHMVASSNENSKTRASF